MRCLQVTTVWQVIVTGKNSWSNPPAAFARPNYEGMISRTFSPVHNLRALRPITE